MASATHNSSKTLYASNIYNKLASLLSGIRSRLQRLLAPTPQQIDEALQRAAHKHNNSKDELRRQVNTAQSHTYARMRML